MTGDTYTTRLLRGFRVPLVPLVCITLAACSGSGGTTSSTPVTPPTTVDCSGIITATDGSRYADPVGAPKCLAHLFVEIDNLQSSGDIPSNARGLAFIFDLFYDPDDDDDQLQLINANGLDGNGNYFLTTANHARLETTVDGADHGAEVTRVYNGFSLVLPAGIITHSLSNTGTSTNPNFQYSLPDAQVRLAYTTSRNDNPLITSTAASSPYRAHRAIYNFSVSGAHDLFHYFTSALTSLSAFTESSNFAEIPTGLIGVGALGNSDANWSGGFRKESGGLLVAGFFQDSLSSITVAARIDDEEDDDYWDSVEVNTDLTDLLARTPTTQLTNLVDHSSWRTPTGFISSTFPSISGSLATLVGEAGQTRLWTNNGYAVSLLDLLAGATVHARTGHYYTASYLNPAGEAHRFNTHCGVLRDGCFILPFYSSPNGQQGTSFAAPRLTAIIDSLWLRWPELTNLSMHRLLSSCTTDLGSPGVDPVFGQGLLNLECLVQPSGGLRIPTAQVAGISGSMIGPSTADTSLATQDDFGRGFNYNVVRTASHTRAFNPLENAHIHAPSRSTMLAVDQDSASAWVNYSLLGDLSMSVGAVHEQDSLLGTYGTGHFQIQNGYSSGARLDWVHRLSSTWNTRMHVAYYRGTAQAVHPGAVSALSLRQSSVSLSLERLLTYNEMATSRLQMSISCNTGTRGSFNSFGTPVTLSGKENCEQRLGMSLYF